MKKGILFWFWVTALSFLLVVAPVFGKEKGKGRPPSWDKGEKKGWQGDVPPGQEKKNAGDEAEEEKSKIKKKEKKGKSGKGEGGDAVEGTEKPEKEKTEKEEKIKEEKEAKTKKEAGKETKEEIEQEKKKEKKEGFWKRWFEKDQKEAVK